LANDERRSNRVDCRYVPMPFPPPNPAAREAANAVRAFGRFGLRRLLGKSAGATVWLAFDPRVGQEVMLTVPRVRPVDAVALEQWNREAHQAARLAHPNLTAVLEIGLQDHWPFVAVERHRVVTLGEWLANNPPPTPVEVAQWLAQALEGLAFAHEAGCSHNDLQLHSLLVDEQGQMRVMGLATAGDMSGIEPVQRAGSAGAPSLLRNSDRGDLSARRDAAIRDVLCCGLLLHQLLAAQSPLGQADTARVVLRMPPAGREIVHLPWTTPHQVPPALRAIANRSTASQERQRYLNARTLLRALTGWLQTQSEANGGPLALLIERLSTVGHLPASPGLGSRVRKLITVEGQHAEAVVAELLQDIAISVELLRQVNSALVRGTQLAGDGAVLTLRRSVALLGVNAIHQAAAGLRSWPGPMSEAAAQALQRLMGRVRLAGHLAAALRPAGYDPEVVFLITVLQNLGRMLVHYHFPDEAQQIGQLMAPQEQTTEGSAAGLSESAASFAVLGVDLQEVGAAVARHWGLGAELQLMIRRIPRETRIHPIQSDSDALCKTASAANDVIDALSILTPARAVRTLEAIAQRYARALKFNLRELQDAIKTAREHARRDGAARPAGITSDTVAGPAGSLTKRSSTANPNSTPGTTPPSRAHASQGPEGR
jgi:HD-like signal output (HDOD) protein